MAAPKISRIPFAFSGGVNVNVSVANADFDPPIQAFMVSAADSDVAVDFADGAPSGATACIYPDCQPGVIYWGNIKRIKTTGTTNTAANVLALY